MQPIAPGFRPNRPPGRRRFRWGWLATPALFLLLAVVALADGTLGDLDADNGLPDAQLGSSVHVFQGLKNTEDTGRFQTYVRPTDKMKVNGVEVTSITYNFFKDELYSISIELSGTGNVRKMLKFVQNRYGKDFTIETHNYAKVNTDLEVREWASKRAYCLYKSATDFRGAILTYVNRPKWDELEVPRVEREHKSRDMLKGSFTNGDF